MSIRLLKCFVFVFIFAKSVLLNGPICTAAVPESDTNYLALLEKSAKSNWRCSEKEPKPVTIVFFVADTGQIYNAQITKSSGVDQTDAECLEAVCELAPVTLNPARRVTGDLTQVEITFQKSTNQTLIENSEVVSYFQKHPDLQKRFVAIHLVPFDILKRKISGLTKESICAHSNLRLIQAEATNTNDRLKPYSNSLKSVYATWGAFFEHNSKPRKAQVDKKAFEIERALSGNLKKP
jgi:hypothetical protein